MKVISVIDCATETLTNNCYNRLVDSFLIPMKFHCPSMFGMDSLTCDTSSAYIILGSYSNVEDRLSWQKELAEFTHRKLNEGIPVLGICFGHQLMADYYGAKVTKNSGELPHNGVRKIKIENEGEATFFVAHNFQVTDLPLYLERLATSKECQNEIIAHTELPFIGVQGHPEASKFFVSSTLKDTLISKDQQELAFKNGLNFIRNFLLKYELL
ncbi:hypothetical protein [Halobacteriovorax sp. JY17]|uniref:type 1 glutamine amidotransferase n=1 Tax=Halobacteriovorax sp. JY17 TaxID=2014617 RepID=UPI000C55BA97|nr:hypothetical protein [Halobacteriovorax sp. JY17]PIK16630.1 MAG: hypothetical protein CES88_07765 [Halobacteriovorax sp. JY17]